MKFIKPTVVEKTIKAPPSKSLTIRAAAAALLSSSETRILLPSLCDDAVACWGIIQALGAEVESTPEGVKVTGGLHLKNPTLDCGESGLCLRLFAPVASLLGKEICLIGSGSLLKRPVKMMEYPLRHLGVRCQTQNGFLPVKVQGPLSSGRFKIQGSESSQFLTGLLMSLPLCEEESRIQVWDLKSKPYILMTLEVLSHFGVEIEKDEQLTRFRIPGKQHYQGKAYRVEGDWSGAAFLLVAGAIGGRVCVTGLNRNSSQADTKILEALRSAGARVGVEENQVSVSRKNLEAFEFDATHCPDLIPALTVLASFSTGLSRIKGVRRLKHKESDRGEALLTEFQKLGVSVQKQKDSLVVEGGRLEGGTVFSHHDHRIAMALAVAGLRSETGVGIQGWECVAKSYPDFFKDLNLEEGKE